VGEGQADEPSSCLLETCTALVVGLAQALAEGKGAEGRAQACSYPEVAPLSESAALGDGLMTRCPHCQRGRLWNDDGRLACLLCSYVARDDISVLERILSNATPEEDSDRGRVPLGPRERPEWVEATIRRVYGNVVEVDEALLFARVVRMGEAGSE
jgi:hypothetical protein